MHRLDDPRPLTADQELKVLELLTNPKIPWPVVEEVRVYRDRLVMTEPIEAGWVEDPMNPSDAHWNYHFLTQMISNGGTYERIERLAWPWEL